MQQIGWRLAIKRTMDISVAGSGLVLLLPVLIAAAGAIAITMGRPVFFRQQRPGRFGNPFRIWKFRTMNSGPGEDGVRLTPLGHILRQTSVDELPQLWNVLRGEMSLVGPRPLLMQYLDRYTPQQARRHEVYPGITGWAQIKGRNALTHEQRFELDLWYVENWNLGLDLNILATTLSGLWKKRGISADGHATMPEFMGCNSALTTPRECS